MTIDAVDPVEEAEGLARVLHACVQGGASVGFLLPFSLAEAQKYWRDVRGRVVLAARERDRIVGTVSLTLDTPPNQPHRGEVAKMLVHPDARRRGVARALMRELEVVARREKRTLLTLDTADEGAAELYRSLGYAGVGTIPDFAVATDGRGFVATTLYSKRL